MSDCTIGSISKKSRKIPDDECGAVQDPVTKFGLDFEIHLDRLYFEKFTKISQGTLWQKAARKSEGKSATTEMAVDKLFVWKIFEIKWKRLDIFSNFIPSSMPLIPEVIFMGDLLE